MRIAKGGTPLPFPSASRRRAHIGRINKETQSLKVEKRDEKEVLIVLPFRQSFVPSSHHPETSSRVTLALLGSVFQTKKDGNIS